MRVLVGNKFWFAKGGTESYLAELVDELSKRGVDVVPFAMKHPRNAASPYAEFFVDEVDYHAAQSWRSRARTAARLIYSRHAAARLAALIDAHPPDIAHLHNIYHQLSPAILPILSQRGVPTLMTLHDLKLACPNYKMRTGGEICERCINGGYHHAVIHRCVGGSVARSVLCAVELAVHRWTRVYEHHVARFIVPSRFYRQKMIEAGLPADRLEWIPNFTQIERYTPAFDGGDYFVYFGRLSEEKGLTTLVDAVRTFTRGTLLIVGDGPARPALERATARLTNIRLVGSKHGSELLDLVRGARFSVIPSEWYENCSMSCIESFACGTPVIAANIGGLPEMVEPCETGLLFAPASAVDLREKIEYLFARPEEAARMGRAARAKAEREYGARRHLHRLVELYHQTLAARYRATA